MSDWLFVFAILFLRRGSSNLSLHWEKKEAKKLTKEKRDWVINEVGLWKETEPQPGWKEESMQEEESSSNRIGAEEKWECYSHKYICRLCGRKAKGNLSQISLFSVK